MQNEQGAQQGQDQSTIREAQQALSEKGHQVPADGKLGPKTQAAVKAFQKDQGLQQTGQLDQQTLAALDVGENGSSGTGSTSAPASGSSSGPSQAPTNDTPASKSE
jgi:peptidoglycan hydrolase-like protein with peptidoglycan-binding domain